MNTVKINQLVTEIKEGKEVEVVWRELLAELKKHKKQIVASYKRDLMNIADTEDIVALYEDCLLDTVANWTVEKNEEYIKYFSASLSKSKNLLIRHSLRDKRVLNSKHTICGDETLNSDTATTVFEMHEDENSLDKFNSVEADIDMKQILDVYENSNKKKRSENRQILEVVIRNAGANSGDYKEELLAVLPENTSWNYARQKLNRAKSDFKEFYKEISEYL